MLAIFKLTNIKDSNLRLYILGNIVIEILEIMSHFCCGYLNDVVISSFYTSAVLFI